jgi:hypothetical protein
MNREHLEKACNQLRLIAALLVRRAHRCELEGLHVLAADLKDTAKHYRQMQFSFRREIAREEMIQEQLSQPRVSSAAEHNAHPKGRF